MTKVTINITPLSLVVTGIALVLLLGVGYSIWSQEEVAPSTRAETLIKIEYTGTLTPKGASIFEDSTHVLTTPTNTEHKLRSTVLDLTPFEEKEVTILGEQASNKRGTINVLKVTLSDEEELALVTHRLPAVWSVLELPKSWELTSEKTTEVTFETVDRAGEISIVVIDDASDEGEKIKQSLAEAESISVNGGTVAYRLVTDKANEVFVPFSQYDRTIHFTLQTGGNTEAQKLTFYQMLKDIRWMEPPASQVPRTTENFEACGGIAQKPCPVGFRCEKTSFEADAAGWCISADSPAIDLSTELGLVEEEVAEEDEEDEAQVEESGEADDDTPEDDTLTTDAATGELSKPISGKRSTWTVGSLGYSFELPSNWWYRHQGAVGGALSKVEIAESEVTDDNVLITLAVYNNGAFTAPGGEIYVAKSARDGDTEFVVSGPAALKASIDEIAASLSSLSS